MKEELKAIRNQFLEWKGIFKTVIWILGAIGASSILNLIVMLLKK